jgi:hypothetical protein
MRICCVCILFVVIQILPGYAQQSILSTPVTIAEAELPISLTDFIERIEKDKKIRFFYYPEWISYLKIEEVHTNSPLGFVLDQVLAGSDLSYSDFQDYAIIFLKDNSRLVQREHILKKIISERKQIQQIRIGNPEDYNPSKTVILKGFLTDEETRLRIKSATISVLTGEYNTISNEQGQYELSLPSGEYLLSFRHANYAEKIIDLQLYSSGDLNVELGEMAILLEEVIIADQAIANTNIGELNLKMTEMKRLPTFLGEVDLVKHVQTQAGVTTVGEVAAGYNVRGGGVDQNLVLFDGNPVFNSSHALGFFSAFNADVVNQISFYKSAISAEFGGRASSVMNVSSREGNYDKWSGSGGIGIISAHANVHGPIKKDTTSMSVSFRTTYSDWMLNRVSSQYSALGNSSVSFYDGTLKFAHKFSHRSKITFSGYASEDRMRLVSDTLFQWRNRTASLRWDKVSSEHLFYSITLGIGNYAYQIQEPQEFQAFNLTYSNTYPTLKADFNCTRKFPTAFGFHATSYNLNPGTLTPSSPESSIKTITMQREKGAELALYYSKSFAWQNRVFVDVGIRYALYASLGPGRVYQYQDNEPLEPQNVVDSVFYEQGEISKLYHGPEPRLSLRYNIDPESSIKVGYNRVHQFIHLISNTAAIMPVDVWQASNTFFKPQLADQVSAGYFKNLKDNMYGVSGELFYKNVDNVLEFKDGAQLILNDKLETALLPGKSQSYGVEVSASKQIGQLQGSVNYTWSRSWRRIRSSFPDEQINSGNWYSSNYDQPHVVNATWRVGLTRRHFFSGTFSYHTGRPISLPAQVFYLDGIGINNFPERNTYRLPDYHRLDLALIIEGNHKRKKLWDGTWIVSAYNVYARQNAYSVFFSQDRFGVLKPYQLSVIGTIIPTITYNFKF